MPVEKRCASQPGLHLALLTLLPAANVLGVLPRPPGECRVCRGTGLILCKRCGGSGFR